MTNLTAESVKKLWKSPLLHNVIKIFNGNLGSKIIGFGATLILIRNLSINDYASYTVFLNFANLVPSLSVGINTSMVKFAAEEFSKNKERPYEIYFVSILLQMLLYITFAVCTFLMPQQINNLFFGNNKFSSVIFLSVLASMGSLLIQAGRSIYQAEEKYGLYIKVLWLRQIIFISTVIVLYFIKSLELRYILWGVVIIDISIAFIDLWIIFKRISKDRILVIVKKSKALAKTFLITSGWLIAYMFVLNSFQRFDIYMLSHFSKQEELANYGVAFSYYSSAFIFFNAIRAVLLPKFSKVDMKHPLKQKDFLYKWLKMTFWLIIPLMLLCLFSKPLFIWINKIQYEKAFTILTILTFGVWLGLMLSPLLNILISRGLTKYLFLLALCVLIFNFTGNFILVPLLGGIGAAIILVLSHLLFNGIGCLKIFRLIKKESASLASL